MNTFVSGFESLLEEYELALNSYGHSDGLVKLLKLKLMSTGSDDVYDIVSGIDMEFDMMVFNNQTEGRF